MDYTSTSPALSGPNKKTRLLEEVNLADSLPDSLDDAVLQPTACGQQPVPADEARMQLGTLQLGPEDAADATPARGDARGSSTQPQAAPAGAPTAGAAMRHATLGPDGAAAGFSVAKPGAESAAAHRATEAAALCLDPTHGAAKEEVFQRETSVEPAPSDPGVCVSVDRLYSSMLDGGLGADQEGEAEVLSGRAAGAGHAGAGGSQARPFGCEVFIGGLAPDVTEEEVRAALGEVAQEQPVSVRLQVTRGTGTCKGYGYATFGDEAAAARAVASLRAVGGRRVGVHLSRRPFRAVLPAAQEAGAATAAASADAGAATANGGAVEGSGAGGSEAGGPAGQGDDAGGGSGAGGCGGVLHLAADPDSTINTLLHAVRNHPDKMAAVAAALQVMQRGAKRSFTASMQAGARSRTEDASPAAATALAAAAATAAAPGADGAAAASYGRTSSKRQATGETAVGGRGSGGGGSVEGAAEGSGPGQLGPEGRTEGVGTRATAHGASADGASTDVAAEATPAAVADAPVAAPGEGAGASGTETAHAAAAAGPAAASSPAAAGAGAGTGAGASSAGAAKDRANGAPGVEAQPAQAGASGGGGGGEGSKGMAAGVAAMGAFDLAAALAAYPLTNKLLETYKVNNRVAKTPLMVLHEYATKMAYEIAYNETSEGPAGPYSVEARLMSGGSNGTTVVAASGKARTKKDAKQVAAAAALEKLMAHHRLTPQDLLPAPKPPAGSRGGRAAQDRPGLGYTGRDSRDRDAGGRPDSRRGGPSSRGPAGSLRDRDRDWDRERAGALVPMLPMHVPPPAAAVSMFNRNAPPNAHHHLPPPPPPAVHHGGLYGSQGAPQPMVRSFGDSVPGRGGGGGAGGGGGSSFVQPGLLPASAYSSGQSSRSGGAAFGSSAGAGTGGGGGGYGGTRGMGSGVSGSRPVASGGMVQPGLQADAAVGGGGVAAAPYSGMYGSGSGIQGGGASSFDMAAGQKRNYSTAMQTSFGQPQVTGYSQAISGPGLSQQQQQQQQPYLASGGAMGMPGGGSGAMQLGGGMGMASGGTGGMDVFGVSQTPVQGVFQQPQQQHSQQQQVQQVGLFAPPVQVQQGVYAMGQQVQLQPLQQLQQQQGQQQQQPMLQGGMYGSTLQVPQQQQQSVYGGAQLQLQPVLQQQQPQQQQQQLQLSQPGLFLSQQQPTSTTYGTLQQQQLSYNTGISTTTAPAEMPGVQSYSTMRPGGMQMGGLWG